MKYDGHIEGLKSYYPFDDRVLAAVDDTAAWHDGSTFEKLAEYYGVADGPQHTAAEVTGRPIKVLTLLPRQRDGTMPDYNPAHRRVVNLSMGNTMADKRDQLVFNYMRMHAVLTQLDDEPMPLTIIGNPSVPRESGGTVTLPQAVKMARKNTLSPVAALVLRYLESEGVETSDQVGYSFGVDKIAAVAGLASNFSHQVRRSIFLEPVSVEPQSIPSLAKRFGMTEEALDGYVADSRSPLFNELRAKKVRFGLAKYGAGILRATNLASVDVMASGGFESRVRDGFKANPDMSIMTIWGTLSELVRDEPATEMSERIESDFPGQAAHMRIEGMRHAGADNINLHSAIVGQALLRLAS